MNNKLEFRGRVQLTELVRPRAFDITISAPISDDQLPLESVDAESVSAECEYYMEGEYWKATCHAEKLNLTNEDPSNVTIAISVGPLEERDASLIDDSQVLDFVINAILIAQSGLRATPGSAVPRGAGTSGGAGKGVTGSTGVERTYQRPLKNQRASWS